MSSVATTSPISVRDAASSAGAWPFDEARKIVFRIERTGQRQVVFETGYGPSGLPHIGTFGEVARTSMVRHAFDVLTGDEVKTRLIAFSDDMDGLRKVPDNIPNKELVAAHLGKPLTQIPDPFGTHASFGAHNNARLRGFLDQFGFDYEFASATDYYTSGRFDAALLRLLARYDAVMAIMLPSFRQERAATYSPFLPIHPKTGIVMQVPIEDIDVAAGTIAWRDPETGESFVTPVTGGHCKLQWKPDWAMRWYALGVDYEMAGKDLIDSVKLSGEIVRALGGTPPEGFNYELFLDEKGQKISKSKGNGLTIEEWLTYASPESLSLFMYQKPTAAKRLYFDVIPRTVDDYLALLDAYPRQHVRERLAIRSGTFTRARRQSRKFCGMRAPGRRSPSACCSISRRWPTAKIRRCSGAFCAAMRRMYRRRVIRASTGSSPMRCAISATSSARTRPIACPTKSSAPPCSKSPLCLRLCPRPPAPKRFRPRSTTSPGLSGAIRTLRQKAQRPSARGSPTNGSTCSTRCCSGRAAARGSVRSLPFMELKRRAS